MTSTDTKPGSTRERSIAPGSAPRRLRKAPTVYFWLLVPALVVLIGLSAFPLIRTVQLSFTSLGGGGAEEFIGFENYARMVSDPRFADSVRVTILFIVVGITVQLVLAWSLALLLAQRISRWNNVLRTLFTIPMMLSPVVIGITWRALLNPQFGWVNALLGMGDTDWTGDPAKAIWVLIFVDVWHWTPFLFLLISAGLMSVPEDVKEAARIDGAGSWGMFRHIIFPLTLPVTLVAILLRAIDATKTFELPFTLTSGGPGNATTLLAIYLYKRAFSEFDFGYASSLAVILLIALVLFALAYMWMSRRLERRYGA
ncbi:carbohydrate ABC transporter permease [Glaciibacter superstes]|uniref:carbohydrate ABC transporter permease n=1 Tax=Glaciibacter superstes TaxID=501023 RepID=UPI0003B3C36B|nr:sugar ABC transporter permease [Glaciibacter superstes]